MFDGVFLDAHHLQIAQYEKTQIHMSGTDGHSSDMSVTSVCHQYHILST